MEDYRKIAFELGQTLISKAPETREDVERMLPELKESEDEKIRKKIVAVIDACLNIRPQLIEEVDYLQIKAWLEKQRKNNMGISEATKQELEDNLDNALEKETPESLNKFLEGEQKMVDKVEPRFKINDKVIHKETGKIWTIHWYLADTNSYYVIDEEELIYHYSEDVLEYAEQKPAEWSIFDYRTWQYIVSDVLTKKDGIGQYLDNGECKKIAKYMLEEWSKRLSVEQKTTELPKGQDYGIDGLYAAIDILTKTLGEVDGYQSDDGILTHKCAISAVKQLSEQKPTDEEMITLLHTEYEKGRADAIAEMQKPWSEEDEKFLSDIIKDLVHPWNEYIPDRIEDEIKWLKNRLKSIKERVQPQQQKWSKEDEETLKDIITSMTNLKDSATSDALRYIYNSKIDWLKSLRDRYRWKPSDEQMGVLLSEVTVWTKGCYKYMVLESLYNDLQKLKGLKL